MRHPDQVRMRDVAVAQHDAVDCAGIERTSVHLSWTVSRQVDVHAFSKRQEALVEGPSANSFECDSSVCTNHADVDHPGGVLHKPCHNGMVHRNLPLNASLEV